MFFYDSGVGAKKFLQVQSANSKTVKFGLEIILNPLYTTLLERSIFYKQGRAQHTPVSMFDTGNERTLFPQYYKGL